MARFVATDYNITINGNDLSSNIASVSLDMTTEEVETTSFGNGGFRSRVGGLKDASITLDFHQDFGVGSVHSILYPLHGQAATVVVKPTSGAVSAQNPSLSMVALCTEYQPVSGAVGDLATLSVSWPLASGSGVVQGTA
jgi:hypothetical protein